MKIEKYIDTVSNEILNKETYYHDNSKISRVYFYKENRIFHREDGPAIIWYYKNGEIEIKCYYLNGRRYRSDGPTIISYDKNGKIKEERYFLNDIEYDILQEMVIRGLEIK